MIPVAVPPGPNSLSFICISSIHPSSHKGKGPFAILHMSGSKKMNVGELSEQHPMQPLSRNTAAGFASCSSSAGWGVGAKMQERSSKAQGQKGGAKPLEKARTVDSIHLPTEPRISFMATIPCQLPSPTIW